VAPVSQSSQESLIGAGNLGKSAPSALALLGALLNDTLRFTAIARVAPTVRFDAFAIFAAPRFSLAIAFTHVFLNLRGDGPDRENNSGRFKCKGVVFNTAGGTILLPVFPLYFEF
jgi:hypothetical protein